MKSVIYKKFFISISLHKIIVLAKWFQQKLNEKYEVDNNVAKGAHVLLYIQRNILIASVDPLLFYTILGLQVKLSEKAFQPFHLINC